MRYEAGICRCGFHSSLTEDKSNVFTIEERRCNVCARSEQYGRAQHAKDEAAKKAAGDNSNAPLPDDGRSTYLRLMSPQEVAARRASHAPPARTPKPPTTRQR